MSILRLFRPGPQVTGPLTQTRKQKLRLTVSRAAALARLLFALRGSDPAKEWSCAHWAFFLWVGLISIMLFPLIWTPVSEIKRNAPPASDFLVFYAASKLTLTESGAAPYDIAKIHKMEEETVGRKIPVLPWQYPPTSSMLFSPIAFFPYELAQFLWMSVPLFLLISLIRAFFRENVTIFLAPIFPGVMTCLTSGQNGIMSAALILAGLLTLDRRPLASGIFWGLLTYKPQISMPIFVILLLAKKWRALMGMIATTAALALCSVLAFGLEPWRAFLASLDLSTTIISSGSPLWHRMVTVFTAARFAGFDTAYAWLLQGLVAALVLGFVSWMWSRDFSLEVRGAALAAAIPLATPYLLDYDLVVLILPLIWLLVGPLNSRARATDAIVFIAAWFAPMIVPDIAKATGIQLVPIITILLLAVVWRNRAHPSLAPLQPHFAALR